VRRANTVLDENDKPTGEMKEFKDTPSDDCFGMIDVKADP
jgi:hypothetical protein